MSSSLILNAPCGSLSDELGPASAISSDFQGLMNEACRAGSVMWHGHQHVCVINGFSPETLCVCVADIGFLFSEDGETLSIYVGCLVSHAPITSTDGRPAREAQHVVIFMNWCVFSGILHFYNK